MKQRLIISYILNIIDLIATMLLVYFFGLSIELNPIGQWLIKTRLVYLFKIVIVGIIFLATSKLNNKTGNILSYILLISFSLLTVYHIVIWVYLIIL